MSDLDDLVLQVRPELREMLATAWNMARLVREAEQEAARHRRSLKTLLCRLRAMGVPLKVLAEAIGVSFQRVAQLTKGPGNQGRRGRAYKGR